MQTKLFFWLLALALACAPAARAAEQLLTVAVFNFEAADAEVRDLGSKAAVLITANLSAEPQLITVERAELEKILGEQELGLSGTVSADTAAKVGHLTGAKVLVTGKIFKADKETIMVAKIISTETSRVYGELVKGPASASLSDMSADLAKKIAAVVTGKGETLVAKVRTREELVAQLKKSVTLTKLPSVSVKVTEQHFGRPVIDPAVETEIALLLKECGFTLVDEKSDQKADIEITGEAFSELGLRKGNLISCRARAEIKVRQRSGGEVLLADRQTTVAVDLAENVAAKSALQNAGQSLAERIIAKLGR